MHLSAHKTNNTKANTPNKTTQQYKQILKQY
jgi:hypothetical protein